jgi:hypothetical protein
MLRVLWWCGVLCCDFSCGLGVMCVVIVLCVFVVFPSVVELHLISANPETETKKSQRQNLFLANPKTTEGQSKKDPKKDLRANLNFNLKKRRDRSGW